MARIHRPSPALVFSLITSAGLLTVLNLWVRHRSVSHWERDLFALLNHLPAGALVAVGLPARPALVPPVVLVCVIGEGISSAALAGVILRDGTRGLPAGRVGYPEQSGR